MSAPPNDVDQDGGDTTRDLSPSRVAVNIIAGRNIRVTHKSRRPKPAHRPPRHARPRMINASLRLSKRRIRACERCLRRHGVVLNDRLENMALPLKRRIIYLWRDYKDSLTPTMIDHIRTMLGYHEPFSPNQAFAYFTTLKGKKKKKSSKCNKSQVCVCDRRHRWARNAAVSLARGIQERLAKPGVFTMTNAVERLSNIILHDICCYMQKKPPSRTSRNRKAQFMIEMADRVAVWIDEILSESDICMLMMDYDEDDEVTGKYDGFADGFLNMMGGGDGDETEEQRLARLEAERILGRPETPEERQRRLELEKRLGRPETPEELHARLEAEKRLGRPETEEEIKKRIAEQDLKKYGPETEAQKQARLQTEQLLGRPETEEERKKRLEIEKLLGRPETPEEMRARLAAAGAGALAGETEEQRMARLEAERKLGRPETTEERQRRLEIEKRLGRPETPEELHARLEAEKRLGRPETEEEIKKRIAEQDLKKYGPETEAQKQARLQTEQLLGRPETKEERKKSLEIEKLLGRPETPEEMRARLAGAGALAGETEEQRLARLEAERKLGRPETAEERQRRLEIEKRLGRPETPEELHARLEAEKRLGRPETEEEIKKRIAEQDLKKYGPETEAQKQARLQTEQLLGRPETKEERKKSLEIEKLLGRPETPEEMRARLAGAGALAGETEEQRLARLEAERKLGRPETAEERQRRLEIEKRLGRPETPEELHARLEAEKRLGRPETEEEIKKRIAEQDLKKYGPETEAQKQARLQTEQLLGRPETKEERKKSLEIEKRLGRPETPEEMRARLAAAGAGALAGETEEQRLARLEAERKLGRPETTEERQRRLEIEKRLGRPETAEELHARLEAEKRLGRPETEEEIKKRIAQQDLKKNGPETEAQKQARLKAENILGRPETEEERKKRLEIEKRLGRPETPEELRARLEAEKRLGRPETPEEVRARMEAEKRLGRPETPEEVRAMTEAEKRLGRPETPEEVRARTEAEKRLGRPETPEEVRARTEAEKRLGRPETPEEVRARLDAEKRLGRPETPEEVRARLEAEKRLGRPETPEEVRARMDAEKKAGLSGSAGSVAKSTETDEERKRRLAVEAVLGRPETPEESRARMAAEKLLGRPETAAEYKARLEMEARLGRPETKEEYRKRMGAQIKSGSADDSQKEAAIKLLHRELKAKGSNVFYEKPQTKLTHSEASDWLKEPPATVDKFITQSGDTEKIAQKFEKKLGTLMANTPDDMQDVMQDVIIESARDLSEKFVDKHYRAQVAETLISELQNRGCMVLAEVNGEPETAFFAAQRLKKAKSLKVKSSNANLALRLAHSMNDCVRCGSFPRKLSQPMKEHIKNAADYLSVNIKPDPKIAAYVALLEAMEDAGDEPLTEGTITKSYKDAANYLRHLTTFEDKINRPNSSTQTNIERKLKNVMANVEPRGYEHTDIDGVIADNAKLLTSYIMLQEVKTEALKELVAEMDKQGDNILLRHGTIRKTFTEGANTLRDKNTDQLTVTGADAVASRKIQIKLKQMMAGNTSHKFQDMMDDVINGAMDYLAVALVQPHLIKVCKCMVSVYVQCELWCEEMLRRMSRPCCKCERRVSTRALASLAPEDAHLEFSEQSASAPGLVIEVTKCPASNQPLPRAASETTRPRTTCPSLAPNCTTSTSMSSDTPPQTRSAPKMDTPTKDTHAKVTFYAKMYHNVFGRASPATIFEGQSGTSGFNITESVSGDLIPGPSNISTANSDKQSKCKSYSPDSYQSGIPTNNENEAHLREFGWAQSLPPSPTINSTVQSSMFVLGRHNDSFKKSSCSVQSKQTEDDQSSLSQGEGDVPVKMTDQMSDWRSMMVSFIWNLRGWCSWMQGIIDNVLSPIPFYLDNDWVSFQRKVITEAVQYRNCNSFLRQLKLQLALRYQDKRILSPTRGDKTQLYLKCHEEALETIDIFRKWTKWLISLIRETECMPIDYHVRVSPNQLRWDYFKKKVSDIACEWTETSQQLQRFWEYRHNALLSEWQLSGPTWVVSACGAVPAGATAAGVHHGELFWLARTTHRNAVMPGALVPSMQCCLVFADGAVHYYSKYQVMCNANVEWVSWRAGDCELGRQAVRVAPGVFVGRVRFRGSHLLGAVRAPRHRCHVIVMGRPFAFHSFELLVQADNEPTVDFSDD